jgi:hypothetical protein
MAIDLRYASIERTASGCTTHFRDGAFVNSVPHDTHHYHEPDYFEIACRRISEALKQPDFFVERPASVKQEVML